jgi:hypothetical protein
VAVILALIWWRRHPRVSLLTLLAIGLSVTVSIVGNFLLLWLPVYLIPEPSETNDWRFEERIVLMEWIGIFRNVVGAVALALLIVAVFIDRSGKNRLDRLATDSPDSANTKSVARI